MLRITDVPFDEVIDYLILNEQIAPKQHNDVYQAAIKLMYSGRALEAPPAIVDFIIANNLWNSRVKLEKFDASYILTTSEHDLQNLSNKLTLPNVDIDRERIIRILGYLGYLNNDMNVFDQLPAEVLSNLLLYLDCKSILLICKLSGKFSKFCEINLVNLLKENLHTMTRLNTNKYNRQQLTNLCHVSYPKYKNISAGDHHSLISIDRQVYACGFNGSGQLGVRDNKKRNEPVEVMSIL